MTKLNKTTTRTIILRIVDANYNRAKEALRTIEDILRFATADRTVYKTIKNTRHNLTDILKNKKIFADMVLSRNSQEDIGRHIDKMEINRETLEDIIFAGFSRAKESLRVLEEIFKIIDKKMVYKFKRLRYNIYDFEKNIRKKRSSLFNLR